MQVRIVAPVVLGLLIAAACSSSSAGTSGISRGGIAGASDGNPNGSAGSSTGSAGSNTGIAGSTLIIGTPGAGDATGSAGGGALDSDAACAATSADGQPVPVDLFFMVDITGSMNCKVPADDTLCDNDPGVGFYPVSRYTVVSGALKSFIADPNNADLGMGIGFFPAGSSGRRNNQSCTAATYAMPNVEIGPLATTSMMLDTAIDAQMPNGDTPTVPSLQGALEHATAWAMAHPTHRVAVVYATDGDPSGCDSTNTVANAATIAGAAFAASPSIPTYVLGVGPDLMNLNQIAAAGSNNATQAFLVDATADAAAQLSKALTTIRTTVALGCTYTIPPAPAGQTFQPGLVRVEYTDSKGAVTDVLQDPPMTDCAKGQGWQYSPDMTQINLCGTQCDAVKADQGGKLKVLFGCATIVASPR
jgi:hypothetical protein